MSKERASDLVRRCTQLVRTGKDFPTVWSILLKRHVLVEGRNRSLLQIPLITGEQLVFDADIKRISHPIKCKRRLVHVDLMCWRKWGLKGA